MLWRAIKRPIKTFRKAFPVNPHADAVTKVMGEPHSPQFGMYEIAELYDKLNSEPYATKQRVENDKKIADLKHMWDSN
jgi:hypothetical protein